jgi:hypothetical protein
MVEVIDGGGGSGMGGVNPYSSGMIKLCEEDA